jgi:DNA-binding MarR family transcriptional regulator
MEGEHMASDPQEPRAETLGALVRELRQFHTLGASFYRAAAARIGMTLTDLEVIDLLESAGPMTAGQLADLTGLTTGAITGMLNRLEEAGFVRRERDPDDGRRVLVRLVPDEDKTRDIDSVFASLDRAWEELAARYDDAQRAVLLEVLKHSNALSREELVRLREAPEGEGGIRSASLGDLTSGRLVVSGFYRLTVRAGVGMDDLYRARFEGPAPEVKDKEGVVTIRYPRRLLLLGGRDRVAEVALNATIPWQVTTQGSAMEINAELDRLQLAGVEIKGAMSMIHLELPRPSGAVPIRITGSASAVIVRRPANAAARVHLKGWAATFVFDEHRFSNLGNDVRLQSPDYEATVPHYDIDVTSSVSDVTITAG